MIELDLSNDSKALVLLGSRLALPREAAAAPLSAAEWTRLAARLVASEWQQPAALFGKSAAALTATLGLDPPLAERVATLLKRGGQLAFELERLATRGIWVLTRADPAYPRRLKERLGAHAPVVLFGAGPMDLLVEAGIAVVGSRDVDAIAEQFATAIGTRAAGAGLVVYSGAARGIDRLAMAAALEHRGTAVGVVADRLERLLRAPDTRRYIAEEQLALVTPFHPAAGFSVANAMARNKLIYCLADYAVVVASGAESGGTRAGALEALRVGWVPLFVRADAGAPPGNLDLIARGGIPLHLDALPEGRALAAWLAAHAAPQRPEAELDPPPARVAEEPAPPPDLPLAPSPGAAAGHLPEDLWVQPVLPLFAPSEAAAPPAGANRARPRVRRARR
jgi:predicted Rossmann fold nucleotide-binding protein DprA/Smf involved in DNA uptake